MMKRTLLYSLVALFPMLADAADISVKSIEYHGNARISSDTILAYLNVMPGGKIDQDSLNTAVKNLYDTGFFQDVRVSVDNGILKVDVKENPLINKIALEGNSKIEDKDLLQELSLKQNTVLSQFKLNNDIQRITALYEKIGRYSATVKAKKIELDQNRINLVFEIDEGKPASIKKINFVGNQSFSSATLMDVLVSKEYRFYRLFSSADVYDPDKLEYDKELLRTYYQNKGYADFKIESASAELNLERDSFLLTFVVDEGIEYSFGKLEINNQIPNAKLEGLDPILEGNSGKRYSKKIVDDIIDKLTNQLGNSGYPFVEIEPSIVTNKETAQADVTFMVKPSYRVYINKINIIKNTRTLDKVIRREFRIDEGDPYNINKIQRSKTRIENLGYFGKVDIKNKKTPHHDRVDLEVEVEEKSTGSINFAGGYNTALGPIGQITLSENNFLGKGQQVSIGTSIAKKESGANFSFTEPYFMDHDISAGFDLFTTKRDYKSLSSFKSKNTGGVVRTGYEISEHLVHGVRYTLKKEQVTDVSDNASIYVKDEIGSKITSAVGHTLAYDTLDSRITPTEGIYLKLEQDLAGLGGDTRYFSTRATASYYRPLWEKDVVFKGILRGGHITGFGGKDVSINDNFFIGPDYIRGFDVAGIGPRDKRTGDALGGKIYYTNTMEIDFPLGLPNEVGLKGAVFHDVGTLHDFDTVKHNRVNILNSKTFRASAGFSLIWNSPLGRINLHYGIPYKKESYDNTRRVYFDFGTSF